MEHLGTKGTIGDNHFLSLCPRFGTKTTESGDKRGQIPLGIVPLSPTVCWLVPSPQDPGHVAGLGFGNALASAAVGKLHRWLGMAIFWGGVGDWLAGRGVRWQSFVSFNVLE